MSYSVHITRVGRAVEPRTISPEEWVAYVISDGEMSLKGYAHIRSPKGEVIEWDAPGLSEWTDPLTGEKVYFVLTKSGRISVSSPSQATLAKMYKVAESLGAIVRGDANEHYNASGEPTQHSQYADLFIAIDKYARARHRCFVAECFLNFSETEWTICARPTNQNTRVLEVSAFKYFTVSEKDAEAVCKAGTLGSKLTERIDRELSSISDTGPDSRSS